MDEIYQYREIKRRMQEYIFSYIWFHYGKEKIYTPKDIYEAIEDGDGYEDLKEHLWHLFHDSLPVGQVFCEIEDKKLEEEPESEEETESESDSEEDD